MGAIKIGVLGLASIARRSVIPAILSQPENYQLIGLGTRSIEKAKESYPDLPSGLLMSYDELLDLPELEALYVPLPTGLHYEWVMRGLNRGLSIISEKSLGSSYHEASEMVELAEAKDLALLENFQFQFHSQFAFLKGFIQSEEFGEMRALRASFGFPPFPDSTNIRYDKSLGGGALLDAGAYMTKVSQLLLGLGLKTQVSSLQSSKGYDVDIWGSAVLMRDDGVTAQLAFGFDNAYRCGVDIWGSRASISTNRLFTARPDFEPKYIIESSTGNRTVTLAPDDHFSKMLQCFSRLYHDPSMRKGENAKTKDQARLLFEVQDLATGS